MAVVSHVNKYGIFRLVMKVSLSLEVELARPWIVCPQKKKAREPAKYFRAERPDYGYLKSLFPHVRSELEIEVTKS